MAIMHTLFFSNILKRRCAMNVYVPEHPHKDGKPGFPVVYLLHGIKQNSTDWTRWPDIEAYVKENGVALVFPEGYRGFYTDMVYGPAYYTYLSQELPELVCKMFGVSGKREDTFVAGLSMGGYGALKMALKNPERFCAGAGLSSVADIRGSAEEFRENTLPFLDDHRILWINVQPWTEACGKTAICAKTFSPKKP